MIFVMDPSEPTPPTAAPEHGRPLPSPQPPWRLMRARRHVLGGVCQGLSVATGVDVTLVRLAFIAVGLTGIGVLAYIVMALLLPREDPTAGRPLTPAPPDTARWLRVALLVAPILSLTGVLGWPWHAGFLRFWPSRLDGGFGLVLIALGVFVIWLRRREDRGQLPAATAPPAARWETRPQPEPPAPAGVSEPDRPRTSSALLVARVFAGLAVVAAILVGAVTIWLERIGALSIPHPVAIFAVGAVTIGLVVAAAIWSRRAMPIVAALATLAVPLVLVSSLASWQGGVGDRLVTPTTFAPMQEYHLAVGRLTLDLTHAPLNGADVAVKATNKIGALRVLVPDDAAVTVDAHAGAGQTQVFGRTQSGLGVSSHTVDTPATTTGAIRLDLDVAVGGITVCHESTAASCVTNTVSSK
jgi:phage shock protein PspC (stress-responsive transcriptional regulator)